MLPGVQGPAWGSILQGPGALATPDGTLPTLWRALFLLDFLARVCSPLVLLAPSALARRLFGPLCPRPPGAKLRWRLPISGLRDWPKCFDEFSEKATRSRTRSAWLLDPRRARRPEVALVRSSLIHPENTSQSGWEDPKVIRLQPSISRSASLLSPRTPNSEAQSSCLNTITVRSRILSALYPAESPVTRTCLHVVGTLYMAMLSSAFGRTLSA
ncbi:uncharacterized protein LOC106729977 isoform X2 [Camelus ferus]|uniref:Uncharacterized protein LOC106729977 isoform X2 n=1 Tax=Camelus ferus TaxID=419612 RepID=A0A8B8TE70_CAMFR|nr:uncharacterized protein LOC106729977 isoform X2 [Camelus ferus]